MAAVKNEIFTNRQSKKVHLKYLDGLRAIAAVYVVIHHAMIMASHNQMSSFSKAIAFPFGYGRYAVDIFIVLSGFCLMIPVVKNNGFLLNGNFYFYLKRAKRILPTYYIAMLFSLILIFTIIGEKTHTHWDISIPVTNTDILTHVLLVQDMFIESSSKINHAFWSISLEWRIYFFFPFILIIWRKWKHPSTTFYIVLLSLLLWFLITAGLLNPVPLGYDPHYLGLFTLGSLAAQISFTHNDTFLKYSKNISYEWVLIFCIITIIIINIIKVSITQNIDYFIVTFSKYIKYIQGPEDITVGVTAGSVLIMLQAKKLGYIYKILVFKPIVFVGTFAYSIYLIHAPLLQIIHQYLIAPFQLSSTLSTLVYFTSIPLIIFVCYIFFILAENPFISKHTSKSSKINNNQVISRIHE